MIHLKVNVKKNQYMINSNSQERLDKECLPFKCKIVNFFCYKKPRKSVRNTGAFFFLKNT